eukprot:gene1952-1190_t
MTSKDQRVVVADLPMMWPSDYLRFEREGGIWGRQMRIRRQQLTFAAGCSAMTTVLGSAYVVRRKNTAFTLFSTFSGFSVLGFCCGMALAPLLFDNVASNQETSMMRRVWWAKECAAHWDFSQVKKDRWAAAYPHAKVPHYPLPTAQRAGADDTGMSAAIPSMGCVAPAEAGDAASCTFRVLRLERRIESG